MKRQRSSAVPKWWGPVALGVLGVALVLVQTLWRSRSIDVMFEDEVAYLAAGLSLFRSGPPAAEGSPLYALWYSAASLVFRDPLVLYFGSWALLMLANLLAFAAALRGLGIGWFGVAISVCLASQLALFEIWPYVTLLSGALTLAALAAALHHPSRARGLSVAAAVLALAVYVRPELLLGFGLCFAAALAAVVKERAPETGAPAWRRVDGPALPVAVLLGLWLVFGAPFGGGRSFMAFGQHYALNVVSARNLRVDPWNNWERLVRADFGDATSAFQALRHNPGAFAWHLGQNLRAAPADASFGARPILRPLTAWPGIVLFLVLCVGAGVGVRRAFRDGRGWPIAVVGLATLVPALVSTLLVFPRSHYFVGTISVLGVATAYAVAKARSWPTFPVWSAAGIALFVGAILVRAADAPRGAQPNLATVRSLVSARLAGPVTILEPNLGRAVLAGLEHRRLRHVECRPFSECLATRSPDVVAADPLLRDAYRSDPGFQAFVADPAAAGFEERRVEKTKVVLYLRRSAARQ